MSEITREPVGLTDQEVTAVTAELDRIAAERRALAEKDPREFILGVTVGRALLSVDELYDVEIDEERFIVRFAPLAALVEGEPVQEQRMTYLEVDRYRDGGTTFMPTQFGEVYKPARQHSMPATLDGDIITPLAGLMPSTE